MVPCQTGNYSRRVSYGDDTQWFHARQETIREKFPMEMIRNGSMPDRKLFAKSFLWKWYTVCPRRTGNYLRIVSYGDDTQWFHAGQETIREGFPMEMIRSGTMPDRKPCKAKEPQKFPRLFFLSFYLSTRWISQQPVTKAMRFGSHTAKVAGMTWPFPRASRKVMMA